MTELIYILYMISVIAMITYFSLVYRISPYSVSSHNKRFRYRVRKYTNIYKGTTDKYYVIFRKYSIFTPWIQVSKDINTADEVGKVLSNYINNDKEKSCVKKKEWLKDEEFLAEAL